MLSKNHAEVKFLFFSETTNSLLRKSSVNNKIKIADDKLISLFTSLI